ncbi:MAG TPA: NifB/NifX family molybdenum-iron cluster-binding protein [Ignavibacteriaceae bacterium]
MESKQINIAVVTDDGITISQHFGRAKYYEVLFVENNKVVKRERREKMGHHNFPNSEHHHHDHNGEHGMDESSHNKHVSMAEAIKDCNIVISRGMGYGAFQSLSKLNINTIITDIKNIDDAVQSVIDGTIVNHTEKLH